ncbi:MAG TPA: VWA domain-containing protein [Candidatus Sulfomarinibacteraceae bacterium]|nr:VWA domain-containing protein [Candidatus Sulfomarinibacteraceae bacterium]
MKWPEESDEPDNAEQALLHNLLLFGRLLRGLGLDVNPGRMIDLVQALQHIQMANRDDFYHTLRCLLVHNQEEIALFDEAFALFWRRHEEWQFEVDLSQLMPAQKLRQKIITPPSPGRDEAPSATNAGGDDDEQPILELTQTYSDRERLRQKDFSELSADEVQLVRRFMAELVWSLGQRQTRRFRTGRGMRIDLRRIMRRNLRYGGEILEMPRRERKVKPRRLVIIADVSGSMEQYTRLLLQFIYSLAEGLSQQVEAFVFSTRLTRITRQLHGRELEQALRDVSHSVEDWSGGTRIGEALKVFNFKWARRVLGQGAVVMLISDGWDRGDPDLLQTEVARLQRSSYRLIWLNPLLGSQRYEPLTRGIQVALPHVDDFLPVHNLASLEDLAQHLQQLDEHRRLSRRRRSLQGAAFIRPR